MPHGEKENKSVAASRQVLGRASPLVTVCIPLFNNEAYLEEGVESILSQGVDDLEVVIVDDGSTDASYDIASRLALNDSRIRVFRQENAGSCVARNHAFSKGQGKYFCVMDADDIWPPGKLKKQLSILEAHPDTIVIGGIRRFTDDNGQRRWGDEDFPPEAIDRDEYLYHLLRIPDSKKAIINTLCCRSEFLKMDPWEPTFRTGHDWEVWIRLARKHPFIHVPEVFQYYRKHAQSTTRANKLRMAFECQEAVLRKHAPSILCSTRAVNKLCAALALSFAGTVVYEGRKRESAYFLWHAFRSGGAFQSRVFYERLADFLRLLYKHRLQKG